jgi:hypothetical protein
VRAGPAALARQEVVAMTATDERLERLEELVETLLQGLEREFDEICPPRQERALLHVVKDEEARDHG